MLTLSCLSFNTEISYIIHLVCFLYTSLNTAVTHTDASVLLNSFFPPHLSSAPCNHLALTGLILLSWNTSLRLHVSAEPELHRFQKDPEEAWQDFGDVEGGWLESGSCWSGSILHMQENHTAHLWDWGVYTHTHTNSTKNVTARHTHCYQLGSEQPSKPTLSFRHWSQPSWKVVTGRGPWRGSGYLPWELHRSETHIHT